LQQIQYWSARAKKYDDGYLWVYNTLEEWSKQFPFWHHNTIGSHLRKLRDLGILVAEYKSESALDRTLFYRIDYTKLGDMIPQKLCDELNSNCEISIYTETTKDKKSSSKSIIEIPDWLDKTDWKDFVAMRKKIGKPMTDRAMKIIISKLENMKSKGISVSIVLQNSIVNAWQDVYEPKVQQASQSQEWWKNDRRIK
jgi:DNA-binding transcriptional ArsR family regulator